MSGNAVLIIVSNVIIFAFTAVAIWSMRRRLRLIRKLTQMLEDAKKKAADENDTRAPRAESHMGDAP